MRELKIRDYIFGLAVVVVLFGLYSYAVRDILASLVLFSAAFFLIGLVALGALALWCATQEVAVRYRPVSRNVAEFSRRVMAARPKF